MRQVHDPRTDAATALHDVTFGVVDLETTGGSPSESAITEIGAVTYRGGERIGTFHTLVDPGQKIPHAVTALTGIDATSVAGEPAIEAVLPTLVEFLRGAVFVAHNARFDFAFLNVALERLSYEPLPAPPVCTARLARRIVWPDVPNVRLETLAQYFSTSVRPTHRAFDDAQACAEVLHGLLDLGGRLGILTLGDLHQSVRARGRPHFAKIRLADALPNAPGVYVFRSRDGAALYVGKSKDLRSRVKQYFYGDSRRSVADLVAATASIDAIPCETELEAIALEARLIRQRRPPYNRRGKTWRRYTYLRLDASEAYPRLKVVRTATGEAAFLGPFSSSREARLAKEALEDAFPIRRCSTAMRAGTRFAPCALADIGRCLAPCDGRVSRERYGELVRELISSLSTPGGLLETLERRMRAKAAGERNEPASLAPERLRALAEALARSRADRWFVAPNVLVLRDPAGATVRFRHGSLERGRDDGEPIPLPPPRERADEIAAVRSWLARHPLPVVDADVPLAESTEGGSALYRVLAMCRAGGAPPSGRYGRD